MGDAASCLYDEEEEEEKKRVVVTRGMAANSNKM